MSEKSSSDAVVVPIEVDALVVNNTVRRTVPFRRWTPSFNLLSRAATVETGNPFANNDAGDWSTTPSASGVYLQWQVPAALRHGQHDADTGTTTFPLLPNRWLVVRHQGAAGTRTATAWLVESDRILGEEEVGVPFLRPDADPDDTDGGYAVFIGRRIESSAWTGESTNAPAPYLTAAGPGVLTFTAFQPFNENVFSIHDDLAGVPDPATVSYAVFGWHSTAAADPLATGDLSSLGWVLDQPDPPPDHAVYVGYALGIPWHEEGDIPSGRPEGASVDVSVGCSSIDALTGLLLHKEIEPEEAALLEALQYGLLDGLDDSSTESVDQSIHRAWFNAEHGGFIWEIADRSGQDPPPALPPDALAHEAAVVAALNQAQAAYDATARDLADLQWKLFSIWWLNRDITPPQYYDSFPAALDPTVPGSVAARVQAMQNALASLRDPRSTDPDRVPWGETDQALTAAADTYLTAHGIDATTRMLKRMPLGELHRANDPVVLLNNIADPPSLDPAAPLPCRRPDELVTAIDLGSVTAQPQPAVTTDHIPDQETVRAVMTEFWWLDQAQLAGTLPDVVAHPQGRVTGTLPAYGTAPWRQPWQPLYLIYEIFYFPIPFATDGVPNWTWDGTRYHWNKTGVDQPDPDYHVYHGRIYLTPNAIFNLADRIRQYDRTHPSVLSPELEQLAQQVEGWQLLSQALGGFRSRLALRDSGATVHPTEPELAGLVGDSLQSVPVAGPVRGDAPAFPQLSSGQFYFNQLHVIDRFGQVCDAINKNDPSHPSEQETDKKPLYLPESVRPDPGATVLSLAPYHFAELRPRLLQGARLRFDCLAATNDSQVIDLAANVDPVCGWVLPNHLDQALAIYAPDGTDLGEIRASGWFPAPGSAYLSLQSLEPDFPHLAQFLVGLRAAQSQQPAFDALVRTIDETLYTVNPLGGWDDTTMTVLAGRPLALVRARLRFELDGPPVLDPTWPNWQYVLDGTDPPRPELLDYPFPVRLGSIDNLEDGLIGYFTGTDYSVFHAVNPAPQAPPYVTPVGTGFPLTIGGDPSRLTMLVDPRGAVHAVSDILPASQLRLPARFVDPALADMEVSFQVGPTLTSPTPVTNGQGGGLVIPRPATHNGDWVWSEPTRSQTWADHPLQAASPVAQVPTTPVVARTGVLRRVGGLRQVTTRR